MSLEKPQSGYVEASVSGVAVPHGNGGEAHKCCGCCCDTRRATIIVNTINIVFSTLTLAGVGLVTSDSFANAIDDDTVKTELALASQYAWVGFLTASLAIVCAGLGIYGGMKYNGWMVMVAGIWYCINATMSMIVLDYSGVIIASLFAYPHFVFYKEMKKGIMTETNYPNEKYSCCCV